MIYMESIIKCTRPDVRYLTSGLLLSQYGERSNRQKRSLRHLSPMPSEAFVDGVWLFLIFIWGAF